MPQFDNKHGGHQVRFLVTRT